MFGGDAGNGVATEPLLSIRRHRYLAVSMDDLVELGVLPAAAGEFIVAAFRAGENLIVAGDHNAGKTTFLRAVCFDAIDPHQRVVTVEAYITELGLHQGDRLPNTVALYSRPPSAEGEGEQTVSDLIRRATRRLNPTRVIVGEILGDEVGPVLDVFSGSTRGSGCTIHARSARGAVRRFEQYGLAANPPVPVEAINYGLAEAAPIIVHLAGDESRSGRLRRYCTSIVEVTGLDDGRVSTTELWGLDGAGQLVPRHAAVVAASRAARSRRVGLEPARLGARAVAQRGRCADMALLVGLLGGLAGFGVVVRCQRVVAGAGAARRGAERLERSRSSGRRGVVCGASPSSLTGWVVAALVGAVGGYVAVRAWLIGERASRSSRRGSPRWRPGASSSVTC